MIKETLFKQTWLVSLAVVLAALQIVFALGIGSDSEEVAVWRIVIFSAWGVGAALVILGARLRRQQQGRGNAAIALGVIPSVATGIIAFWFPPMWLVTAAGLAVMWSSIRETVTAADVATAY